MTKVMIIVTIIHTKIIPHPYYFSYIGIIFNKNSYATTRPYYGADRRVG